MVSGLALRPSGAREWRDRRRVVHSVRDGREALRLRSYTWPRPPHLATSRHETHVVSAPSPPTSRTPNPSSLVTGSSSHKKITQDVSRILWYYYNDSRTLFIFCFCNELFFVALYLMAFIDTPISSSISLSWPQLLAILNFPIMFGKQIINCVQFWKASKIVSGAGERVDDNRRALAVRCGYLGIWKSGSSVLDGRASASPSIQVIANPSSSASTSSSASKPAPQRCGPRPRRPLSSRQASTASAPRWSRAHPECGAAGGGDRRRPVDGSRCYV